MRLHFVGSGDAFGSGGRFNNCFLVERGADSLLIDCSASSFIAMRKSGIDPQHRQDIGQHRSPVGAILIGETVSSKEADARVNQMRKDVEGLLGGDSGEGDKGGSTQGGER